jgi:hypothetical protein
MIQDYVVDCHVDVVLIGPTFNAHSVEQISSFLETLANLGFVGAPLPNVHEKLTYHISLAKQLEKTIISAISNNAEQSLLASYFEEHHKKAGTGTTLFVLNFPFEENSKVRYKWSNYVSSSGYAWINVNSIFDNMASYVSPLFLADNILPSPSSYIDRAGAFDVSSNYQELAVLVHRSIEQLVPSIMPNIEKNKIDDPIPPKLHIRIFTICGFPLDKCQPDSISIGAAEALSTSFTDEFVETKYSSTMLHAMDSKFVTQALLLGLQEHSAPAHHIDSYFAATGWHDSSHRNAWRNVSILSTDEFLFWMEKAPDVAAALQSDAASAGEGGLVVPVFSLLLPDDWNLVLSPPRLALTHSDRANLCGRYRGMHIESEVKSGVGGISASMISCGGFLPASLSFAPSGVSKPCAIVVLRRDDLPAVQDSTSPPRRGVARIPPPLSTGLQRSHSPLKTGASDSRGGDVSTSTVRVKTELRRDNNFEVYELGDMIMQIAWGMPPSYIYYSPSSQHIVRDFLWYDSLYDGDSSESGLHKWSGMYRAFRHTRMLKRHVILHKTNTLVDRIGIAMNRAVETVGVGARSALLSGTLSKDLFPTDSLKERETLRTKSSGFAAELGGNSAVPAVVKYIKTELDKMSADYSHLEYDLASDRLAALEEKVRQLETMTSFGGVGQRMAGTLSEETGVYGKITCRAFDDYSYSGDDNENMSGEATSRLNGDFVAMSIGMLIGAILVLCLIRVSRAGSISIFTGKRWGGRRVVTR